MSMIFDIMSVPIFFLFLLSSDLQYLGSRLINRIFYTNFTYFVLVFNGNSVFLHGKWLDWEINNYLSTGDIVQSHFKRMFDF